MYSGIGFTPKKNDIIFDVGTQFADFALLWNKYYGANVYAF